MPVGGRSRAKGSASLARRLSPVVRPPRAARLKAMVRELQVAIDEAGATQVWRPLLEQSADLAPFLASVFDASPFLRETALIDPARLVSLLAADPDARFDAICAKVSKSWQESDEPTLMTELRQARAEAALLIALADLGNVWSVDRVTEALTTFAGAAVAAATNFLLIQAHRAETIRLPYPDDPGRGSGWILLGMGKFGAGELNYSSDIDLIVLYDPDTANVADRDEVGTFFVKLTRRLVRILQERTADGYVFRTDLRLRPDPGSTPLAVSTPAAFTYYELSGQNWSEPL